MTDYDDDLRDQVLDALLAGSRSVEQVAFHLQVFSTSPIDCLHDLAAEKIIGWGTDGGVRAPNGQSAFPFFHLRPKGTKLLEDHRARRSREEKAQRALAWDREQAALAKGAAR